MSHESLQAELRLEFILPFLLCVGCASQAPMPEAPAYESFIEGGISAVFPGPLDANNRYSSNVAIHTNAKRDDGSEHCSGILVSPRDILTAGHCVCMKRQLTTPSGKEEVARRLGEAMPSHLKASAAKDELDALKARILANTATLIDPSLCASLVEVEVIEYLPQEANAESSVRKIRYIGKAIHPHPRLLVLEDATGSSWFREADLALIHLSAPVNIRFRPIKLPEREVKAGNAIVMVGHGLGENGATTHEFGDRHYGESIIETVERLPSGSVKFLARAPTTAPRPAPRVFGGDSGGGCFSKTDDRVLIGVISAFGKDGDSSIFTSVFAYEDWLKKELNHEGAATGAP
jgi:hypothetical protein